MKYFSICSGIEAATVAWGPLGWEAVAFAEIEKFPSAVLAHHYPEVPNLGDMTQINGRAYRGNVDVLAGGTPCQSFSVAGLGKSLADPRGQLTMRFLELANEIEPAFVIWENVPGVLNKPDNPFGCLLGGLAGEDVPLEPPGGRWANAGYVLGPQRAIAWRVLDAQYFNLAQRRARVFVVACPRGGTDPRKVLFEREGLRRDSPPSREAGGGTAHDIAPSLGASGRGFERAGETRGQDPVIACFGGNNTSGPIDVATACNAHGGPHGRLVFESETFVCAPPLTGNPYGDHESREDLLVAHSLRAGGFDASEDGTGPGTPLVPVSVFDPNQVTSKTNRSTPTPDLCHTLPGVANAPVAFSCKDHGADAGDVAPTLRGMGHDGSHANAGGQVAVAFNWQDNHAFHVEEENTNPLRSNQTEAVAQGYAVRRLTPIECERLQGFPDNYTLIAYRGKPAKDGPRYKALGNSMAVPVMRWIGQRIQLMENTLNG